MRIGEAPADACPAACCPYEVKTLVHGVIVISGLTWAADPSAEALGHVRKGKTSSSGILLIVRQLCSDTRFTSQSNRGQRGIP